MFNTLTVNNFTVFSNAQFEFGCNLNVIIGENGNGKTQILKLLYGLMCVCQNGKDKSKVFKELEQRDITSQLERVFGVRISQIVKRGAERKKLKLACCYTEGKQPQTLEYALALEQNGNVTVTPGNSSIIRIVKNKPIFLSTHELLSIYPNFVSLDDMYSLPYDGTYRDTILALGLPYLKETPRAFAKIVARIEKILGGKIVLEPQGGHFYLQFNDKKNDRQDIDMTAEGWRKLGTLMQLLRNGALAKDCVLFWDEPEANLNPKLVRILCEAILELSQQGIQVFLTTHSLFLVNEIEILAAKKKIKDGIRYFNFCDKGKIEQGNDLAELHHITLLDETMSQSDRYLDEEV